MKTKIRFRKSYLFIKHQIVQLLFLFVCLTNSSLIHSQISFAPYKTYPIGSRPETVAIGDVNNDGLNDVVVGTSFHFDAVNDYKVFVFLQNGLGNLQLSQVLSYPDYYSGMECLVINDVNNDKLNDVVISFRDSLGIYYQNNSGTLNNIQKFYSGNYATIDGLSIGDLNSDGLNDIIASHWGGNIISILYQNNNSGFSIQNYNAPTGGYDQIEIADINNDKRNDIILLIGQTNSYGIYIYLQNNTGTFDNYFKSPTPDVWSTIDGFAVGDINNDGVNDLVELLSGNSPNSKIVLKYQDTKTSQLLDPIQLPAYDCPEVVKIDNLNCDKKNEVIVLHGGWDAISVYEQDENYKLNNFVTFPIPYASHYNHQGMSIGDINNDGKKDIAIADYNNGLVILINQSIDTFGFSKPILPMGTTSVCSEGQISIYKTVAGSEDKVTWNLLPPEAGNIIQSNKDSCVINWNSAWRGNSGIYTHISNTCGFGNSDTLIILSNRLPALNLGNDTTLCSQSSIKLNAGSGFYNYLWQDYSRDSVYLVTKGGKYSVETSNNCGTRRDTINITEIPLPKLTINDTVLCTNTYIHLNVMQSGVNQYKWQDNSTDPDYYITAPGNYSVTATNDFNCSNSRTFKVTEISPPNISLPSDTFMCYGAEITLNTNIPGCTYFWNDGSNNPQLTIYNSDTYFVNVSNQCGSVIKYINVSEKNCECYLDVPNAFSPNGDGINDGIRPYWANVDNVSFVIYNRWGQKVFESSTPGEYWDGTFQGKKLEPAVFIYYLKATSTIDGHPIEKHGNITLIR